MRSRKLMQALEETSSDINPHIEVTSTEPTNDDTEVMIQDAIVKVNELDAYSTSIEDAEEISEALSNMSNAIQPAVDSGKGIEPHEADVIQIVTEHFKSIIGYSKVKQTIPSLESFGSTMSKVSATKLAIEGLAELVSEINIEIDKSTISRFTEDIKSLESIDNARKALLSEISNTTIKCKEFFKSPTYSEVSSNIGSEIVGGEYTKNIFVGKDAINGKMPVASVLAGMRSFKLNNSVNSYVNKLSNTKTDIESFINAGDFSKESTKSALMNFIDIYNNLITTSSALVNDKGDMLYKRAEYPLSNLRIETSATTKESLEKNNWWDSWVSIYKENLEPGKLVAMSDVETLELLSACTELLQSNEYIEVASDYIVKMAELNKMFANYATVIDLKSECRGADIESQKWNINNAVSATFVFVRKIAIIELRILKAINNYALDSISFLSTREKSSVV